jgi:hypothetical protein
MKETVEVREAPGVHVDVAQGVQFVKVVSTCMRNLLRLPLRLGCLLEIGLHPLEVLLIDAPLLLGVPLLEALLVGWEIVCGHWLVGGRG